MRLLHTETFQLREFFTDIPQYAILSHTWDKEEVTFQDLQDLSAVQRKSGWKKVQGACNYAQKYKFQWIWIDSCCINKESSAELSEAINSMYQYYLDAHVCYVYLSDTLGKFEEDPRDVYSTFRRSRWFTRGWTLQELLAPNYVVFLGKNWTEIGTRWSLRDAISAITSIPIRVFENGEIDTFSIAQKMSWAALRKTTRPEDQAYCLMGLFGVSMSPIYGEGGPKAFMRLQQEIIKISDDRSIFAWTALVGGVAQRGLLASSPREFAMSGEIGISESDSLGKRSSFSFNNNGLHIHLPLLPIRSHSAVHGLFLAPLHCRSEIDDTYFSVYLQKLPNSERYVRCRASDLPSTFLPPAQGDLEELVVRQDQLHHRHRQREFSPSVKALPSTQRCVEIIHATPSTLNYHHKTQSCIYRIYDNAGWEEYHFSFHFKEHPSLGFQVSTDVVDLDFEDWPGCSDRISVPLKSGDVVATALHITPNDRELEVGYVPKENPYVSILTKELSASRTLGFLVSTRILCDVAFTLESVFPPDYFQIRYSGDMIYSISMPDFPTNDSDKVFRLLVYNCKPSFWSRADAIVYIALGFCAGSVWTDVIVFPHDSKPNPKEVWSSYLDGGLREKARLRLQSFSSCQVDGPLDNRVLAIKAKKRSNLQRGSHSLQINLE
ncbi:hypothetical protein VKT23_011130 [Stygiomarasmius scandens]|uniref:Heterokaryon incompatibility domain-containing protein n=1 Tax=Marasmiellus scandens TaxID=2682957 RepID=A0ABR1JAT1_9AGAR